jgi:hypothetical protein
MDALTDLKSPGLSSRIGVWLERLYRPVRQGSNRAMGHEHSNNPHPTGLTTQEDDALAQDLVLGILPDAEREAAERREAAEPAFAQLVQAWRQRLALLPDPVEPVAPPKDVWDRISARIDKK